MKLLYITNGITGPGGLERVLSVKASLLADDFDYEVNILTLNEMDKESFYTFSTNVSLHSFPVFGNPVQYFSQYKNGIQKIVNQIQPDIILVCDDGLKGFFLPRLIRTTAKWIYERHVSKLIAARIGQGLIKSLLTRGKWFLMEKLGQDFSRFIVLTEGNINEWKSLTNLEVIPNPLSFYPTESSSLTQKTVICVGKISYQKGQDVLVKAWNLVWNKHPDWKLELYGTSNENFLNTEDLKRINVYHFPPEINILEKYLNSSIYVMSSRFEGFGMVLIEAMACGVPCISFDCNYGPSDIIENNEDGLLVEKGEIDALANHINQLIEREELRKTMGKKAKVNVRRFAPAVIVSQWDQLFKEITA
ncbi:glycosyltransferase family 4 protein [Kaistella antarctica]|uniref:D-inositol-3-phosphate glycosyltransferase n=1 Tax=Kaistella antarctica TaxID=266748 RepID=A0A3S4UYF5_9FLAO|nr:glycosyltransferase family 4 protein [Kaistella antarctica]KEY18781.1 hypothetical protein HY04_09925 [Kaistella antarctica]SEW15498.1 Glycosyltransferase involved in cell wall bisynthesis [Kaistella antarctica]VEH99521.1 D-inositol-3-phosphate glycosyltransferase [Kaistella antarctica]